jgi:allantoinase
VRTRFLNLRVPIEDNSTEMREIVVDQGRFVEILPSDHETAVGGEEWINLEGALVLPGVIDSNVHFGDPGFTHREDFASGTCAAAAGGVTCVADMPGASLPPVTNINALKNKLRVISGKAHIDFMLWGGVSANCMEATGWAQDLIELVDAGVAAVKVTTSSSLEFFREIDQIRLREVMEQTRRLAIPLAVHAEEGTVVDQLSRRIRLRGGDLPADYAASRPAAVEVSAVAGVVEACRMTGARVHIVHLASGEALDFISAARLEGLPITAETCPHFLEFTKQDLDRLGSVLKTAPVIKSSEDRTRLWQGLASGELSFVTTDHSPAQWPEEKNTGSIWTDHDGVPGVELLLPYLYSEGVCTGKITLERMMRLLSVEPARFLGINHRKGRLKRGLDADFVVFDEHETWTVRGEALHNLNRYTPLEGRQLTGRVRAVYLRGQCVYQRRPDGSESFAPQGTGKFVKRGLG